MSEVIDPNAVVAPKTEEQLQADAVAVAEKSRADALAAGTAVPDDAIKGDDPVKPEGVPDKFWDAEKGQVNYADWSKAHTDLETKFHAAPKTDEEKAAEKVATDKAAADAAANPVAAAQAEYAKDGTLSDTTYATLEKSGLDRATVDAYIEGQTTRTTALTSAAHDVVGGAEKYTEMVTWAAESLSPAEVAAYNAQVDSNDPAVIKLATEGLAAKFAENATVEGKPVGGNLAAVSSGVFESKAEMTAAMGKPSESVPGKTQYEIDPAYRAAVQKKVIASRAAGKNIFI